MSKFERICEKLNSLLATVFVYLQDVIGSSLSLK